MSFGTHIVGGMMTYRYLGPNRYEITLTVFRDCFNGIPPLDPDASIGVFNGNGDLISNLHKPLTFSDIVQNAINSPCLLPPQDVCYEVGQYVFDINLPASGGPFTIAYQRCCRNNSINNIANVQGTGSTYFTVIDPATTPVNSSPAFKGWPPTFICRDAPFTLDNSASDADGDSLVYEISRPYDGGSQGNPIPNPPDGPPYSRVVFKSPYSVNNPLGGVPMHIDPTSGRLTATPDAIGEYVYGVSVKEYRNGVLIGETTSDIRVNVINCPNITVAAISPAILCGKFDAQFNNLSYNASTYKWYFGDPTSVSDSSDLKDPLYVYPDTGHYIATLIAYSPLNPDCNDTATTRVDVYPEFNSDFYLSNIHCSNVFSFTDMSNGPNGNATYWLWDFGDNSTEHLKNPVHTYSNPGPYNVALIASVDSACNDTVSELINVLPVPVADFNFSIDTCKYEITLDNNSTNSAALRWEFGDFENSYDNNVIHKYKNPGNYNVSLIVVTDSSCKDTADLAISIPPLPEADFSYSVPICDSAVQFGNLSSFAVSTVWDFGDSDTSHAEAPLHTYSISGKIPVTLYVESAYGCKDEMTQDIFFVSQKIPDFEIASDSCNGDIIFVDKTNHAAYYNWKFGDGATSTETNPVHRFLTDGSKTVTLVVNMGTQCVDSVIKTFVYEAPMGEKIFIPNSFTPNGDGHNDIYSVSIFRPCETYHMTIFNRWGQKVFETDDATNFQWDGSFNGDKLAEDVYVYILENSSNRREGTITILR